MDTATVRAMLMQSFEHSGREPILAHEMYHDDAVLDGGTGVAGAVEGGAVTPPRVRARRGEREEASCRRGARPASAETVRRPRG